MVLRDDVTGEWRKIHNEELNGLHSSPNIVWVIKLRWAGHVASIGDRRDAYRVLVWETWWKDTIWKT